MTATLLTEPFPLTGNQDVDLTTNGYKWYFDNSASQVLNWTVSSSKWSHPSLKSVETQDDFKLVFKNIAEFINVDFNFLGYVDTTANGYGYIRAYQLGSNINISFSYNGTSGGATVADNFFGSSTTKTAFCNFPDKDADSIYSGAPSDVWMNYNNTFIQGLTFEMGTNGFGLLLHEVLHGLGLKHPHDDGGTGRPTYQSAGFQFIDRQWVTVMSYDETKNGGDSAYSGSQPIGPMIMDAIGLQYLYGESKFNESDTVYDLRNYVGNYYNCQWDYAGEDKLNGSGLDYGIVVDLGIFSASNGVATHHAGYITSVLDSLWIEITGNNPDKWTWLWGEYENVDGTAYDDVISGNDLNNKLNGGSGNDSLVGGAGDDVFDFSASQRGGQDTLVGGLGNDVYVIDSILDVVVENSLEGVDQIFVPFNYSLKGTYIENIGVISGLATGLSLSGNSFANEIRGGENADSLYGLEGNDSIYGYDGNDLLSAGSGNDSLYGGNGDDKIYSRSADMSSTFDDGGNLLSGEGGNDSLYGGLSDDILYGGDGNDYISAVSGGDYIDGGAGEDTLTSGDGLDTVHGGAGNDKIYSRYSDMVDGSDDGANIIYGDDGNDSIFGGNSADSIYGGLGDDSLLGYAGNDSIAGNDGNDYISGSGGNDVLNAGNGADTVYGGDGDDLIYSRYTSMDSAADDGANYLDGGKGNDTINGGLGDDTIVGGEGSDSINASSGIDRIIYSLDQENYSIAWDSAGGYFSIASGIDEIDIVKGVEKIVFNGVEKNLDSFKDSTGPAVLSSSPTENQSNVSIDLNIVIIFNENVKRGVGEILLKTSSGVTFATYTQDSQNINITGNTLTINPSADLNYDTVYFVELARGSVLDLAGNDYTGSQYAFTTNFIPVGTTATITTDEDTPATGTLAGTDLDGNTLTFAKVADPSHGTVSINATTGAYTYTPAGNYNGSDSFTFKVNDGTVDSAVATVSITVAPVVDITGHIYHWKSHSLLQGVQISNVANTANTDINGNYHLNALNPTSDLLIPTLAAQSTGSAIDISDALAALKIAVGRNPNDDGSLVTPYQYIAADVNEDGVVTAVDALAIYKMALARSDAPQAKWLFVNEAEDFWNEAINSFTTSRKSVIYDKSLDVNTQSDVSANLVAVLKGDVNGNWAPPAGTPSLDTVSPNYFAELATRLGSPQSQWGVIV